MSDGSRYLFGIIKKEQARSLSIKIAITVASLVVFIIVWWLIALQLDLAYVPTPDKVFAAFIDSFQTPDIVLGTTMWDNIGASLERFAIGFALAFLLALPIGLLMGYFHFADMFLMPLVEIFRPIPPIAWVPVFLLIFSVFWGPVMVILIGVFFPLLSNVIFGVRSVDKSLIDAAKTMGAKRTQMFSKVILPYTVPYLMTGITIGLGIGWMCIVAAEMIGAVGGGVGYYIQYTENIGKFDYMYAGMAVIAILGILTVGVSRIVEKQLNRRMGIK
ncbi:MAG: ABC transporter permease [Methanomassiliicoccales archaeon]|nr:ABC transporter permease [Methanomassiliicoccales archaeon]